MEQYRYLAALLSIIEDFQKIKKRLPAHVKELKDFFKEKGYRLSFSPLHYLKIEPVSYNTIRVEYSIQTGPDEWTPIEKAEMTCLVKEWTTKEVKIPGLNLERFSPEPPGELQLS